MDTPSALNSTTVRTEEGHDVPALEAQRATSPATPPPSPGSASSPRPASSRGRQAAPPHAQASWLRRDWRFTAVATGMRVLSSLAPARAAALLDRLWFTAPRLDVRGDAAAWLARGTPLAFRVHGGRVCAWSWGRGPTVLLVHGWGGNAGQMQALVAPLIAQGFRVVALDAPAHGRSDPSRLGGRRVSMIEIADAIRVVAAGVGPLAGLVAHSGGCTATALALRDGWQGPARLAFLAPFAVASSAIAPFGRALGASDAVIARFRTGVERAFGRPWTDFDATGLPARRAVPGLLVVHDAGDREVPIDHGRALVAAWPGARLIATQGLGHRRVVRDADVVADVVSFLSASSRGPARRVPADARDELDRDYATAGLGPAVPQAAPREA